MKKFFFPTLIMLLFWGWSFLWTRDWEGSFKGRSSNGKMTIFIFDADTIDAYPIVVHNLDVL
jgi:hypothetical protein